MLSHLELTKKLQRSGGRMARSDLKAALKNPPEFEQMLDSAVRLGYVELLAGIKSGDVPCVFVIFKKSPLEKKEDDDVF